MPPIFFFTPFEVHVSLQWKLNSCTNFISMVWVQWYCTLSRTKPILDVQLISKHSRCCNSSGIICLTFSFWKLWRTFFPHVGGGIQINPEQQELSQVIVGMVTEWHITLPKTLWKVLYFYVIFKNQAGVLYWNLKHEAIAECFRSDKAPTASF